MDELQEITKALASYPLNNARQENLLAFRCCELACTALGNGCYGVGAVIFDSTGRIMAEAGNEIFLAGFHSARHAEMVAMDRFEDQHPDYGDRSGLTLLASLEPCPMCLTRMLISGIGRISYLAADHDGGMINRIDQMPDVWRNLALLQKHDRYPASQLLATLAARMALCNLEALRQRLIETIRPNHMTNRNRNPNRKEGASPR